MNAKLEPGLYIVATPIGNLSDLSPRAATILSGADMIACEDSRVTAKLLQHIGVKRPMMPYHDHNADRVRSRSEEHTSELQSLMRVSYAVFCFKKNTTNT